MKSHANEPIDEDFLDGRIDPESGCSASKQWTTDTVREIHIARLADIQGYKDGYRDGKTAAQSDTKRLDWVLEFCRLHVHRGFNDVIELNDRSAIDDAIASQKGKHLS